MEAHRKDVDLYKGLSEYRICIVGCSTIIL